ncbi:MAG: DUF1292 domain-containing protein [Lachnospiraceae bacterium]|nr:DUF1292 domain-containing protein [Lachnospiraceae bacterium]
MGKKEHDFDDDVMVTLELDDGVTMDCEILTIFDIGDQDYILLAPQEQVLDPDCDDYDIFVYRYYEMGENYGLENIESDEEMERVSDRIDELMDEDLFDNL